MLHRPTLCHSHARTLGKPNQSNPILAGPVLVGASLGGMALLRGESKARAAGLVLVDVAPTLNARGIERIIAFMWKGKDKGTFSYLRLR